MPVERLLKPGEAMSADRWIALYSAAKAGRRPIKTGELTREDLVRRSDQNSSNDSQNGNHAGSREILAVGQQKPPLPDLVIYRVR